ncbi:MAG TPA: hypothetical protein VF585_08215 [Chthoniobacterales bacterium]|jgi:hypothetical protein
MNNTFLKAAAAFAIMSTAAFAQTSTSETSTTTAVDTAGKTSSTSTTTTTESNGMITSFTPGSAIVLKETSGPRSYKFGKSVTYVTKSGKTVSEEEVKTRVKVGVPVNVSYAMEGDSYIVNRVIIAD